MKYFLKKTLCKLLCMLIVFSSLPEANANEVQTFANEHKEYVTFISGNERMESDGDFAFNVRAELRSDSNFTAKKTSIKISTKCKKLNVNSGANVASSKNYTVTLYNAATNEVVDFYTGVADGTTYNKTFTVVKNQTYYFVITCDPALTMPYSLYGTGTVTNVTVLNPS